MDIVPTPCPRPVIHLRYVHTPRLPGLISVARYVPLLSYVPTYVRNTVPRRAPPYCTHVRVPTAQLQNRTPRYSRAPTYRSVHTGAVRTRNGRVMVPSRRVLAQLRTPPRTVFVHGRTACMCCGATWTASAGGNVCAVAMTHRACARAL